MSVAHHPAQSSPRAAVTLAIQEARRTNLAAWTVLVVIAWAVVGLALLILSSTIKFPPPTHTTAVGTVTVHHYPKYQETIYFVLAVVGVPAVAGLGWLILVTTAVGLAALGRTSVSRVLKQQAFGSLSLFYLLPHLLHLEVIAGKFWWRTFGLLAGWALLCLIYNRLVKKQPVTVASAPEAFPVNASAIQKSGWLRRLVGIAGALVMYLIVPVILYALKYSPHIDGGVDLFHEGEFLVPLLGLQHGLIPYRDLYLQHGLFHNALIPWLGGWLFGPTLAAVRTIHRIVDPLGFVAVYFLGLSLFRGRLASALVLAFILCGTQLHTSPRTLFGMLALAGVATAIRQSPGLRLLDKHQSGRGWRAVVRHGWPIILAGVCSALAFWYSVEVGLYCASAIGIFLFLASLRGGIPLKRRAWPLICFAVGWNAGFWAFGWYFLAHGALGALIQNVIVQCRYQTEVWGLMFPNFFTAFRPLVEHPEKFQWPQSLATRFTPYYLPPAIFTIAGLFLIYRLMRGGFWKTQFPVMLLLLVLADLTFFRSVLGRTDGAHSHYGIDCMLLTAGLLTDELIVAGLMGLFKRRARFTQRGTGLFLLLCGSFAAWVVLSYSVIVYRSWDGVKSGWHRVLKPEPATLATTEPIAHAGKLTIPAEQIKQLQTIVAALQANAGPAGKVFDFTNQSGVLFFADRLPATRYFHVCYAVTEPLQQEVIVKLDEHPTLILLSAGSGGGFDGVPQTQRTPLIAAYLASHYVSLPVAGTPYALGIEPEECPPPESSH